MCGLCDESPTLPATASEWVWLGDSLREQCPPVFPSIKSFGFVGVGGLFAPGCFVFAFGFGLFI